MKGVIFVDAGHGGVDPGAGSGGGKTPEASINLEVAKRLRRELQRAGYRVHMSRLSDFTLHNVTRAKRANNLGVDLFVSIHCNSSASSKAHGFEVWTYLGESESDRIARVVLEDYSAEFPELDDRGERDANFTVLRETRMPAILVELAFISNPRERAVLEDPTWQARAAGAVARGVARALEGERTSDD